MRKKTAFILALIVALVGAAALILYIQQTAGVQFSGDRVKSSSPESFSLRFDVLNKTDSETLKLNEGDTLRVSWKIDAGTVELSIAMEGEDALYRASGRGKGDEAAFDLTIPKTGNYVISITGRNAKGSMAFVQARDTE